MDFDGIARQWASSNSLSSPALLALLLTYDTQQLNALRVSVARHANLAHAVELIDVLASFQRAKQQLDDARQAALRMAELAQRLAGDATAAPALALTSVEQAVHAQEAAHLALDKAQSGREKMQAAVVLELADAAAAKALQASQAADELSDALARLVRATQPDAPLDAGGGGVTADPSSTHGKLQ